MINFLRSYFSIFIRLFHNKLMKVHKFQKEMNMRKRNKLEYLANKNLIPLVYGGDETNSIPLFSLCLLDLFN